MLAYPILRSPKESYGGEKGKSSTFSPKVCNMQAEKSLRLLKRVLPVTPF